MVRFHRIALVKRWGEANTIQAKLVIAPMYERFSAGRNSQGSPSEVFLGGLFRQFR